jgi:hypothetical protein
LTASGLVEIKKIKEWIMEEKNKLLFVCFFSSFRIFRNMHLGWKYTI